MDGKELCSTKYAAEVIGVSQTYFRELARQPEPVEPKRLRGSMVLLWTGEQVNEIKSRVKRSK
jgi:hypothetical protein